jgi:NAD(P)-dependent dehydrogenase (short-subunit alcohol dehydrogenase family)
MKKPVTLITGASTGIGAAFADVFAEHHHAVVLVSRRQEKLESVADAIESRGRVRPSIIAMDLTREGATEQLAVELQARGLEPSVVVNNAGFGLRGEASELDRKQQLEIIDLNIRVLTDLSLRWIDTMLLHWWTHQCLVGREFLAGTWHGGLLCKQIVRHIFHRGPLPRAVAARHQSYSSLSRPGHYEFPRACGH